LNFATLSSHFPVATRKEKLQQYFKFCLKHYYICRCIMDHAALPKVYLRLFSYFTTQMYFRSHNFVQYNWR